LKRLLFLVHDFPTLVSELRFWQRISNQGRKSCNLSFWPESASFEDNGVHVWRDALRSTKEVANGAHVAKWVMYNEDLICVSRGLRHMRGGSALWLTDLLWLLRLVDCDVW